MKTYQRIIAAVIVGALSTVLSLGCDTIKGAGKDIQKGGKAVENAAEEAQQ